MLAQPLSSRDIIRALGGASALARLLPANRSAIANWGKDGVPAKYWPIISRLARDTGGAQHITLEELERHIPGRETAEVPA